MTQPLKILLVDDDELILEAVAWLLESLGHQVTVAASGMEGLDLLHDGLPADLLILDQNMPGLSGLETLGQVRAFRPALPAFVATGYRDEQLTALVEAHPRTLVIHKPFRAPDFEQALARLEALGDGPAIR